MSKIKDVSRWRVEITLAEKFKEDQFGIFTDRERSLAGENIDYYERGFTQNMMSYDGGAMTTLNIIDPIVTVILSSLYLRNPRTLCIPTKVESELTAPIVARTIDYYRKKTEMEEVNRKIIWDAYVLGFGVYKVGYATKFGADVEDPDVKQKPKNVVDKAMELVGLKKKVETEEVHPEVNYRIISENPYIVYINPFDFLMDPRATSLHDATWWGHGMRKSVAEMKRNKKYKNTEDLRGVPPETRTLDMGADFGNEIEEFETVNLWEIHYRNDDKFYILVISKDGGNEWREHYHAESIYEIDGWQCDMLTFKKHGHMLYPRSDISKVKLLQDRISTTIDAILEQVDKFVPKLAYQSADLTEQGKMALMSGGVGALVECNADPNGVFKELNFTQLKGDLLKLIDEMIQLISIQTGITRAQLTGMTTGASATETQISQGGQTLKLSDMNEQLRSFLNRQSHKFWSVIKQFVNFDELQLINGQRGIDEKTGAPVYDWLFISEEERKNLSDGKYEFDIEVGSTQRADIGIVRKAFENMFNVLARPEVVGMIQQQGQKVALGDILKKYFDLFPELGVDANKIVQNISGGTTGLLPQEMIMPSGAGGPTSGSATNQMRAQRASPAPSMGNLGG